MDEQNSWYLRQDTSVAANAKESLKCIQRFQASRPGVLEQARCGTSARSGGVARRFPRQTGRGHCHERKASRHSAVRPSARLGAPPWPLDRVYRAMSKQGHSLSLLRRDEPGWTPTEDK
eukprot:CAMPEP_0202050002 /NCGR_PEP_ID=MMETSP0963-20130614/3734_1 /ASSEMBLY_ACC=CAM_ASM_000494 /TAXON_ID=4773 /ORGANISM="Schizochytrium aggregatum, Strain ATCC28209" /LENGTH=118 /DNA_ID=CAMNT_0048615061 /DNA_START=548 /DNA_END=904 /DNA_ORIENTATION=+